MRVFVTGATGFVGTMVVDELIRHGHQVTGLARSPDSAEKLKRAGASVQSGSLEDLESLKLGVKNADGVINCAFSKDFSRFAESGLVERSAVETLGRAIAGSSRPLVVTSGVALLTPGRISTEEDPFPPDSPIPRNPELPALAFVEAGVRVMIVRLSPSTHGGGKGGFAGILANIARDKGISAYVGDGENRWAAVHHKDAARLFRLALESGTAGSRYHAVAEQGVPTKDIAVAIGNGLNIPTASISAEETVAHFGWFKDFAKIDTIASSELTQTRLAWRPTHPGLIADLKAGIKA